MAQAYLDTENIDDDTDSVDDEVLSSWLKSSRDHVSYAAEQLRAWLAETNLDEYDYEVAERRGNTSQGAALLFWRDGGFGLDPEAFGVVIVDGDHPGSSYYAAELEMPIEDANQAAKALGVPIRFV